MILETTRLIMRPWDVADANDCSFSENKPPVQLGE